MRAMALAACCIACALACAKKGEEKKVEPAVTAESKEAAKTAPETAAKEPKQAEPAVEQPQQPVAPAAPAGPDLSRGEAISGAQCAERVASVDRKLRSENLPLLMAEQEAATSIKKWAERTYQLLDGGETQVSKAKIAAFWQEYGDCLKQQTATREERDPECVAMVTGDPSACQRIAAEEVRTRCLTSVAGKPFLDKLLQWAKGGFSPEMCGQFPAVGSSVLGLAEVCRAIAERGECSEATADRGMVTMCRAAQAGFQGKECGGEFPEGTPACKFLRIAKAENRVELCKQAVTAGELPLALDICERMTGIAQVDCDKVVQSKPAGKGFDREDCKLYAALKLGKTSCEGLFEEKSDRCMTLIAVQAALAPDKGLCATFSDARYQERCRTFFATTVEECTLKTSDKWGTGPTSDASCRKMLWEKKTLPATEGRIEVRISLVNVFAEAAVCDLVVEAKGKTSSASQSAKVSLKGSEVKGHSLFLSAERDAIIDTKVTCTWEPSKPAAPSAEAK